MAEDIRIPVRAETSQMLRDIENVASKARVSVRAELDSRQLDAFSRPLGKITGQADEFTKSMEAANARVLAFGASVGVLNAVSQAFRGVIASTVEVEKSLKEISVIGDKTFSDLDSVSKAVFNTAKQLGVSYKEAANATLEFARQGKGLTDSLQASKAALALTRTTGLDAAESVRGLTAAVNVFSDSGLTYIDVVNKMSSVDSKFAVNSKDLIEGISRSASVAQEAGVSFDELTALITTLQEKTARGGAVIGNALKTIFTRVQNPEILKDIRDLGIAVTDSSGNFLPATRIIQSLANEFNGLDKNVRNNLLLKVGGGFQIDKLAAALNDMADANGTFQRSLQVSQSGVGDVLNKVSQLNQNVGTAFDNLMTSAKETGSLIGRIGFSEGFTKRIDQASGFFNSLNEILSGGGENEGDNIGGKIAKGILKGIGSIISGPGLFLFGGILIKLTADLAKFSKDALQTQLGISSKSKEEEAIQKSITNVLANNASLQNDILNLEGNKTEQAALLLSYYTKIADQMQRQKNLTSELSKSLYEGGVRAASGKLEILGKPAKTAADGYVPNLAGAIAKEKMQAPNGSRIIVDHNFPMGGGERGTMVYNSNETRIKNYAGTGGDAIIPNYPINAVKGYTPNFAKKGDQEKLAIGGKGELAINASAVPLAGLTLAGESRNLPRSKAKEVTDSLLKDYVNSPFFEKLRQYDKIVMTNVPVGNVYKFRKDLKGDEDTIKADFVSRINQSVRPQILDFIQAEIKALGLKPGAGLSSTLSNLKLNLVGSSTAGYILEEILKAPTLTTPEKVAQYAAQSEKSYFDIYKLSAENAEAYGLPKRDYEYADVKLGEKELYDTLTRKFLNQAVYEGGGTKLKNAANGYVPNFADSQETFLVSKRMSDFGNIDVKDKADGIDKFSSSVKIIRQKKSIEDYSKKANQYIKRIYPKSNKIDKEELSNVESYFRKLGASDTSLKQFRSTLENSNNFGAYNSSIKGILGELDAKKLIGKNIQGSNSIFDFAGYIDARTRRVDDPINILKKGVNFWLRDKSYKNKNYDNVQIPKLTAVVPSDSKIGIGLNYGNAANGYIPNFAKTSNATGSIIRYKPSYQEMDVEEAVSSLNINKGTRLTGTNLGYKGYKEFILNEDNIISSILGNNTFFQKDASTSEIEKNLFNFVNRLTAQNEIVPFGKGQYNMEGLAAGVYNVKPKQIISGNIQGKFKNIDYSKLSKIFPRLWRAKGVGDTWDMVKEIAKLKIDFINYAFGIENASPERQAKIQNTRKNQGNLQQYTQLLRSVAISSVRDYDKDLLGFNINIGGTEDEKVIQKYGGKGNVNYLSLFGSTGISNARNIGKDQERERKIYKTLPEEIKNKFSKGGSSPYGIFANWYDKNAIEFNFKSKKQAQEEIARALNIRSVIYDAKNKNMSYVPNFASENAMRAMREIAKGNTPEAEAFRNKLAQLEGGIKFETAKNRRGAKSYVAKLNNKIVGSVDYSDLGSQISLDSATGNAGILQQLLSNFALQHKGKKISYPSYSENASLVKSILKLKDGIDLEEGDLVGTAAKGFIPNFASSVQQAIVREKLATGLPDSMIKVSNDSRAIHSFLNPTGQIVTNKIDEPNGGSDVPTKRIKNAYTNAARGFAPNFAGAAGNALAIAGETDQFKNALNLLTRVIRDAASKDDAILNNIEKISKKYKLSADEIDKLLNYSINLSNKKSLNKSTDQNPTLQNTGDTSSKNIEESSKKLKESAEKTEKSFGDLAQKAFIFQSGISFATGALSTLGKEGEALGDVLNSLGQVAYTATQGMDLLKTFTKGRGISELIDSVSKGAEIGGGGKTTRISTLLGRAKGAIIGTAAVEGGAAATGLGAGTALGAVGAVAGIGAAIAGSGYVLYKAVDSIGKLLNGSAKRTESAINAFNAIQEKFNVNLSDREKNILDKFTDIADVSGTSLSGEMAKKGYDIGALYRRGKAALEPLGFKDETYKDKIRQKIAQSGLNLDTEANKSLAQSIGNLLLPIVSEKTMQKDEAGVIKFGSEQINLELLGEMFGEKLKELQKLMEEEMANFSPTEIEIQEVIKKQKIKNILPTFSATFGGGMITPGVSAETQAKSFLTEQKRQKAIETSTARLAKSLSPESLASQAKVEEQKGAILLQTELFKKRLDILQQISKIEGTIPTALESSLSIEKELLSTNEGRKFQLELRLKQLQEERQLNSEIKDLVASASKDEAFKFLDKTQQVGVPEDRRVNITQGFENILNATNTKDQLAAYEQFIKNVDIARTKNEEQLQILNEELTAHEGFNDEIEKQIQNLTQLTDSQKNVEDILKRQIDLVIKQSQARRIQSAQAAQEKAIIEKTNYYYNLQKEIFSAQVQAGSKKLEQAQQELELQKKIRDLAFERSQFEDTKTSEPRKQYQAEIRNADEAARTEIESIQQSNAQKRQSYLENIFNDISSKTTDLGKVSEAAKSAKAGDEQALKKIYEDVVMSQGASFETKVVSAAAEFELAVGRAGKGFEIDVRGGTTESEVSSSVQNYSALGKLGSFNTPETIMQKNYIPKGEDLTKDIEVLKRYRDAQQSAGQATEEIDNRLNQFNEQLQSTAQAFVKSKTELLAPVTKDLEKEGGVIQSRRQLAIDMAARKEYERTTFGGGVDSSIRDINLELEQFRAKMGREIPYAFRDGMVSALKELANPNSTEPLKNRLLGVATAFFDKINDALLTRTANQLTSALFGGGGGFGGTGFASGGLISGGSGTKDDVPAMLMAGEYVLNKSAVQKYGPSYLQALNNGTIKKFADGGGVGFSEIDITKYQDPTKTTPYGQIRDKGLLFDQSGKVVAMNSYTGKPEDLESTLKKAQTSYYSEISQSGQGGFYMPGQNGAGPIMGAKNLLAYATQQKAGTSFDKIKFDSSMASIDFGAGSANMSLFALRDQENSRNAAYLESKNKSLDAFLEEMGTARDKANQEEDIRKQQEELEKQYQEDLKKYEEAKAEMERQIKEQEKMAKKAMLMQGLTSLAMVGLSAGFSAMSSGWTATNQAYGGNATFGQKLAGAFTGGTMGGETRGGLMNMFSSSGYKDFSVIGSPNGGLQQWNPNANKYTQMSPIAFEAKYGMANSAGTLGYDKLGTPFQYGWSNSQNNSSLLSRLFSSKPSNPIAGMKPITSFNPQQRYAAGGYVAGSGMGDNVPAMLNGGEFVISKQATENIGVKKLQEINSSAKSSDSSQILISKLDEIVEKLNAVGTINISVNSNSGNQSQTESSQNEGTNDPKSKELARRLKDVVLNVLKEEKRLGGMLR